MEAGTGYHASEERDCEEHRHPHLQGGDRAENRECYSESVVGKEVIYRCKITAVRLRSGLYGLTY